MIERAERRDAFLKEARQASEALHGGDLPSAWLRLERAHILGQPWAAPHIWSHAMMLRAGWRTRDWIEVRGQTLRLLAAGLLSLVGWLPVGNTGRARVSAFAPMPVPNDLRNLVEERRP